MNFTKTIFRLKPIDKLLKEVENSKSLNRCLGPVGLTALGISAIIGAGIFILTGVAARGYAGPAISISFIIAAIVAGLTALSYAEMSAMIPVSGSAYTYTYASMGELVAWLVGWNLILEYLVSAGAVATSWSSYFNDLLRSMNVILPKVLTSCPFEGGIINLPAVIITLLITFVALLGTHENSKITKLIVAIKIIVIVAFVIIGAHYIDPSNWVPFAPYGVTGIMSGAALVFYSYIGFDAVSTAAEETKKPKRDLPIGIIGSLVVCALLYIVVSIVITGIIPYSQLDSSSPISNALLHVGVKWGAVLISIGAITGFTSVIFAVIFSQSRIFYSMSRDGLLPKVFSITHKKLKTPHINTILVGSAIALTGGFFPVDMVAEMTNIGTYTTLILVSIGVIILRKTKPDLPRPFKVPFVPLIPILAILSSGYLMVCLSAGTWIRFIAWLVVGFIVYYFYGMKRSQLNQM